MLINNLDRTFRIGFEKDEKKIRVVILNNDQEAACRKEFPKKLKDFINDDSQRMFKGRLQLTKKNDEISIVLKNEVIGTLTKEDFLLAIGS